MRSSKLQICQRVFEHSQVISLVEVIVERLQGFCFLLHEQGRCRITLGYSLQEEYVLNQVMTEDAAWMVQLVLSTLPPLGLEKKMLNRAYKLTKKTRGSTSSPTME
ncbi:hypothetical protein JTB14_025428 [Gonioctena quinquepunctata]|nr:hypothetical protein JTB14_025428 [Gonioctena quinquepunctata]